MFKSPLTRAMPAAALLFFAVPAAAFRLDAGTFVGYKHTDWDRDAYFNYRDDSAWQGGVKAQLYFKNVNTENKPLNEAAYMDRAGSFTIIGTDSDGEIDSKPEREYDRDHAGIAAKIVIEDMIIWDIQAAANRYTPENGRSERSRYLRAGIGSYFLGNHSVILYIDDEKPLDGDVDGQEKTGLGADYQTVISFGSQHLAAGGGFALRNVENKPVVDPGFDIDAGEFEMYGFARYYPLQNLGVFARLDLYSYAEEWDDAVDTIKGDASSSITLGVNYFPVDSLYIEGAITSGGRTVSEEDDNIDEEVDASVGAAKFSLGVRF